MKSYLWGALLILVPFLTNAKHPFVNVLNEIWETIDHVEHEGQYLRSTKEQVYLLQEEFHVVKIPISELTNESKQQLEMYNPYLASVNHAKEKNLMSRSMMGIALLAGGAFLLFFGLFYFLKRNLFVTNLRF